MERKNHPICPYLKGGYEGAICRLMDCHVWEIGSFTGISQCVGEHETCQVYRRSSGDCIGAERTIFTGKDKDKAAFLSKERILIIEDEMDLLNLVDFNLRKRGFVTEGALDGRDGIEKIGSFNPEVIILDLMLPGVDGWAICAELKKRKMEIPVIMVTAKAMPEDKVRGLEAGAADYITKPFSMKELVMRIDKVLEKKGTKRSRISSIFAM